MDDRPAEVELPTPKLARRELGDQQFKDWRKRREDKMAQTATEAKDKPPAGGWIKLEFEGTVAELRELLRQVAPSASEDR